MASAWSQLDQLLTCAICLDRYRNPKLLPCQHTFCMEPCLDGLIDYARRQIKCPECRAEHRIPYQGIQQFPTNVTLMRFLELHRDITGEEPEPPPSMMERCSVCSEKSNVEKCAHCDKKICFDCKEAHVDILRREINRINNQVRRGLHRLSEALTQTKKNAEKLQFNCTQVKEEIEDIVRRYSKDLKVTEDKLKLDLEVYTQSEMKSINKLKEDLEIEVNNISSNCELVDKYITDDFEWSDVELLEYKQIFIKMLDFLRTFDPDSSDFSRRIKFQPRADPDVLHRNIADFGELKINAPMNAVPTQQSLMPPTNALMRSQSDHRLAAQFARRCDNRSFSDINQRLESERDSGRPTSPLMGRGRRDVDGYRRYSDRSRDYDYQDRVSSRYGREDTALSSRWRDNDDYSHRNRYPRDYDDCDSEPHQGRTVRFADEQSAKERVFKIDEASKGPLSGIFKLLDSPKVMERLHQNEVKQKQQQAEKEKEKTNPPQAPPVAAPQPPQPKRQTSRQQSEDDIDRQKRANQQASSSTSTNAPTDSSNTTATQKSNITESPRNPVVPESPRTADSSETSEASRNRGKLGGTTTLDEPTETPRNISRFARAPLVKAASLDGGETSRKPLDKKVLVRAATPVRKAESESDEEDEDDNETFETAKEPPKQTQSSFFTRQRRLPDPEPRLLEMHESDSDEESESEEDDSEESDEDEEEEQPVTSNPTNATTTTTSDQDEDEDDEEDDEEEEEESSSTSESESVESTDQVFNDASDVNSKKQSSSDSNDASNSKKDINHLYENDSEDQDGSSPKQSEDEDEIESEEYRTKTATSSTIRRRPVDTNIPRSRKRSDDTDATDSSSASSSTNYHSLSRNTTPLVSPNGNEDRMSSEGSGNDSGTGRFRKRPFLARSKSSHEIGLDYNDNVSINDEDEESEPPTPTYRTRPERKSEDFTRIRPSSIDTPNTASNNCWATYLKNKYGSNAAGRVVPRSRSSHSLYQRSDDEGSDDDVPSGRDPVLSSTYSFSNPRSTYMQKRRMLLKLGSRGTESSNFTWPRGVAVGPENSIAVADSSNHRIQVFDSIGKFLFEFGSYGSADGEFDCPAGVSVNRIGQFIVSDRYNHRVQLFDPTGRFLRAFGCEGRTDGRFNYPWGIATDSLGFIYVCDKENHRVQVFQSDGTFVGKFGGQGCRPGQLEHPHYVAVTNTNRVVVTDTNNHRVQVFDVNGRSLTSFGSEGSSEGQFKFPRGVAVDDQGYIVVGDSGNNRIEVFQPDGTFLRSFGCWGSGDGEFKGLEGLAVTSGGSIIACDRENHRIQVF